MIHSEVDFDDAWYRQIEADRKLGQLDPLWREAMEGIKADGQNRSMKRSHS